MELFVSPGTLGLPTCDPNSLLVLTYLHLGRCRLLCSTIPHDSTLQNVPLLCHDGIEIRGVKNILSYLRRENYGLEYILTDYEKVQLATLVGLIEYQLTPAVEWFLWAEDDVFRKFTRKCYIAGLSWFAATFLPFRWRRDKIYRTQHIQLAHCMHSVLNSEIRKELYSMARSCLNSLSYILGNNMYFVANTPTAVDAYVFAHIWPLLLYESRFGYANWSPTKTDCSKQMASHPLITHLMQCPNLVAHFVRIQAEHFPQAATIFAQESAAATAKRQQTVGLFSTHPVRDSLCLFTGMACLFLLYAKTIGLIRISAA